jgi:hypothetical protein
MRTCSSPQDLSNNVSHPICTYRIGSILDFLWSRIKLPVWLPALLLPITCVANVQMAHARPFSTSTLQGLSNGIKNTSRRGVFPSAVELWNCRSPRGPPIPTFGSVSLILTLASKWGCDKKCSNYTLTNLLFGFCRFVWIIEPLVAHPNPILELQHAFLPLKCCELKSAPQLLLLSLSSPLDLQLNPLRNLGGCHQLCLLQIHPLYFKRI